MIDLLRGLASELKKLTYRCDIISHPVYYKGKVIVGDQTIFVWKCDCGKEVVHIPYEEKSK